MLCAPNQPRVNHRPLASVNQCPPVARARAFARPRATAPGGRARCRAHVFPCPAAPRGARLLLAACLALAGGQAVAQVGQSRSAGPEALNRSAPTAALPAVHAAATGAGRRADQFHADRLRRRHHRLRRQQTPASRPSRAANLLPPPLRRRTDALASAQPAAPQRSPYQAPIPPLPGDEPGLRRATRRPVRWPPRRTQPRSRSGRSAGRRRSARRMPTSRPILTRRPASAPARSCSIRRSI